MYEGYQLLRTRQILLPLLAVAIVLAISRGCRPPIRSLHNASSGEFIGEVVAVHDGDTVRVLHDGKEEKVRLFGIDCPELGQAFGRQAREFTSAMAFGKMARVSVSDTDRCGRTIGELFVDGKSVNRELVKAGYAWAYIHFSAQFEPDESVARRARAGLWADSNPIPPWDYRRNRKKR